MNVRSDAPSFGIACHSTVDFYVVEVAAASSPSLFSA